MKNQENYPKPILKNNKEDIIDAIGDSVVVLTNLAHLVGTDIEDLYSVCL
jgi:NTP pyrophosphatase (non-canonical NTP hydrolase)